jgi:serine-type D-Ala-D-Ala carboxypeptidase/endopeptidase (penicillin-binding protein 4)
MHRLGLLLGVVSFLASWGCAHAREEGDPLRVVLRTPPASRPSPPAAASQPTSQPATRRIDELRSAIEDVLRHPDLKRARVSLLAAPVTGGEPIVAVDPDIHRVPASNAKLLTTTAAALLLPGRYRFLTEVTRCARGQLCLWGTGDPVLSRADLVRLAREIKARGVRAVRGVVVDDSHFDRERYAPGYESFSAGAHYRATSGALNVDSNAIVIQVSTPADRRRPRVDVSPPSDYVVVRKQVKLARARRGPEATAARITVTMQPRGSLLQLTISGTMGRKAPAWSTKRAVYDPALNAGWALRRALTIEGVTVSGGVRRGKRVAGGAVLARREHSLGEVLRAANQHSDNLAAENLVRALSFVERGTGRSTRTWPEGLGQLRRALATLEIREFEMGNGSGLHRRSWATARTMVTLLQKVYLQAALRRTLLPTLAVAGRAGTLAPRLRRTAAEGFVVGKTGTLGGALALSGYVDPQGARPLAFSILLNGRSDNRARDQIDRLAELLARFVRGLPLAAEASSQPASQPASAPAETE